MARATRFEFTNRALKALPAHAADAASHAAEYSDTAVVGLKIAVGKSGRKTFQFRYVYRGGKRCARIGEFPAIDVAEARRIAMSMRAQLDRGLDPQEARDSDKAMPFFREFALNQYLPHAFQMKRSAKDDESKLRNHLLPRFGDKRLCDITRRDIELYHAEVKKSHTPGTANRHLALLSAIYRRAIEWGRIDRSPCAGVKQFRENNASERWLSQEEIVRLYAAMDADRNQVAAAALKLALLTGARRGEITGLKWSDLDLERGIWLLHGDRTKNGKSRRIVLSRAAIELLAAQPCRGVSPYVFPGRDGADKPIDNLTKPFNRMLAAAGVEKARIHDLRHTHASHLVANGVPLAAVKDALGHGSMQVTSRYTHLADSTRRHASEVMARVVEQAVQGGTQVAEVPSA